MPRGPRGGLGGGRFIMGEVPLYVLLNHCPHGGRVGKIKKGKCVYHLCTSLIRSSPPPVGPPYGQGIVLLQGPRGCYFL